MQVNVEWQDSILSIGVMEVCLAGNNGACVLWDDQPGGSILQHAFKVTLEP